jgi:hypothetical protein
MSGLEASLVLIAGFLVFGAVLTALGGLGLYLMSRLGVGE